MSEQGQVAQGSGDATAGAALKALAAAAAGGAATYAVRKALASRNGHDHADKEDDEGTESKHPAADSAEEEQDVSEAEDEDVEDEYTEDEYTEASAEEDGEYEDDDSDEVTAGASDRSSRRGGLRRLVTPARAESASRLLLPLAEQAAGSAGRYLGEHAPEAVRKQILPRFIDAFEEAM